MVALARKTLLHEWRRYLPAAIAVGFAGLLLFVQAALVLGIFSTAGVLVSTSSADIWVGYPGTPSIELGRPISNIGEMRLRMDPRIAQVESLQWLDADWRGPNAGDRAAVMVAGINTNSDGLMFARVLPTALRERLREPQTVVADPADVGRLGIDVGQYGHIDGHRVRLIGVVRGLRGLGAVTLVASTATARSLGFGEWSADSAPYYLARLKQPAAASAVVEGLNLAGPTGRFEAWTAAEFARRATLYWLFDTGAGLGFFFSAALVFLVGAVITSQTLNAAIAGSLREFAMLRAMGVTRFELSRIVVAEASWLGGMGLLLCVVVSMGAAALAYRFDVPIVLSIPMMLLCALGVMAIAWLSGLAALSSLSRTDPAELLRV